MPGPITVPEQDVNSEALSPDQIDIYWYDLG